MKDLNNYSTHNIKRFNMNNKIFIPKGRLAEDDAALKAKREALKKKLLEGGKITLKNNGSVTDDKGADSTISIPKGKLADDDAALKARRAALKEKLLSGKTVTIKPTGNVMDDKGSDSSISIPPGKLAANQWYEKDPGLLEQEKVAMEMCFPHFKLDKLDDGRLYWMGELNPGIYETKYNQSRSYTVMAVYNNNHPYQQMGSSVRVYPMLPDAEDLCKELYRKTGQHPFHLLRDSIGERYLCTNNAEDQKVGSTVTTAASVLAWAVKWLMSYELVLTDDLDVKIFNQHGGV